MARQLTVQSPGATCHPANRGNRRAAILRDETGREGFLRTLGQACRNGPDHDGPAVAPGDHHDAGLDRRALADGHPDAPGPSVGLAATGQVKSTILILLTPLPQGTGAVAITITIYHRCFRPQGPSLARI